MVRWFLSPLMNRADLSCTVFRYRHHCNKMCAILIFNYQELINEELPCIVVIVYNCATIFSDEACFLTLQVHALK